VRDEPSSLMSLAVSEAVKLHRELQHSRAPAGLTAIKEFRHGHSEAPVAVPPPLFLLILALGPGMLGQPTGRNAAGASAVGVQAAAPGVSDDTAKKLTYYTDILKYYRALAAVTPRVKVISIGTTDEGRERKQRRKSRPPLTVRHATNNWEALASASPDRGPTFFPCGRRPSRSRCRTFRRCRSPPADRGGPLS
jgi:hypothetical protein